MGGGKHSCCFREHLTGEVRRISLLGTSVNLAASVSEYKGVGTFSGLGKGRTRCRDNRRAPNSEIGGPLKTPIHTALRSQNGQVAKLTYGVNFGEFPF